MSRAIASDAGLQRRTLRLSRARKRERRRSGRWRTSPSGYRHRFPGALPTAPDVRPERLRCLGSQQRAPGAHQTGAPPFGAALCCPWPCEMPNQAHVPGPPADWGRLGGRLHASRAVFSGCLVRRTRGKRCGRTARIRRASAALPPPRIQASATRRRTPRPCLRGGDVIPSPVL
jgi:hypothetical protein